MRKGGHPRPALACSMAAALKAKHVDRSCRHPVSAMSGATMMALQSLCLDKVLAMLFVAFVARPVDIKDFVRSRLGERQPPEVRCTPMHKLTSIFGVVNFRSVMPQFPQMLVWQTRQESEGTVHI